MTVSAGSEDGGAFSPDGKLISFISGSSGEPQVWVAHADGTAAWQVTFQPGPDIIAPLWLPDNSGMLVSVRSRAVGLRNLILRPLSGPEREMAALTGIPASFSHDGKWLYFSLIKKDVDIYKYSMDGDPPGPREARGSSPASPQTADRVFLEVRIELAYGTRGGRLRRFCPIWRVTCSLYVTKGSTTWNGSRAQS